MDPALGKKYGNRTCARRAPNSKIEPGPPIHEDHLVHEAISVAVLALRRMPHRKPAACRRVLDVGGVAWADELGRLFALGGRSLAVGETVILLHPPLPVVGVSIAMGMDCQQNDSLADGYLCPCSDAPRRRRP